MIPEGNAESETPAGSRGQTLCKCNSFTLNDEFFCQHQQLPPSNLFPSILSTCRLIYNEAAPLLYRQNSFHFADPTAIERFAAATDQNHNTGVENLFLTIHSARNEVRYRWETALNESKVLRLAKHLPNLRNVVIKLRGKFERLSGDHLVNLCTTIAKQFEPCKALKWIHVNGLIDANAIMAFAPAIKKPKRSDDDGREAQTDVRTCWSRDGWTNVTIWWGNQGDRPPTRRPSRLSTSASNGSFSALLSAEPGPPSIKWLYRMCLEWVV
ncbi:hypothetical protein G7Y79_00023g054410 [Physcia stellaris]|nr:hypothetical protein G7Y79_00023g054410 [Physcia stellaris]